jgi:hypothetical protein
VGVRGGGLLGGGSRALCDWEGVLGASVIYLHLISWALVLRGDGLDGEWGRIGRTAASSLVLNNVYMCFWQPELPASAASYMH